jgi:hypothetical protein
MQLTLQQQSQLIIFDVWWHCLHGRLSRIPADHAALESCHMLLSLRQPHCQPIAMVIESGTDGLAQR